MRIGALPPKSHDWKMGNSQSRGKGNPYSKEEIEFLKKNYLKYSDYELSKMFNRSIDAITGVRSRHGLNRERKPPLKVTIRNAFREVQLMREIWALTQDMKALIIICQLNISNFKKEQYKKELLKLSVFNVAHIKHL